MGWARNAFSNPQSPSTEIVSSSVQPYDTIFSDNLVCR